MIEAPSMVIRDTDAMRAWTTTSIASRHLVALLDDAGRPVDDLLAVAGVTREALAEPDAAMPLDGFRELWARAAAVVPDIGVTLVDRFPPGQMHILAHLALRSATVGAALDDVCRYATVTSAADQLTLERDSKIAHFRYACRMPGPANPWMAEHYLSMTVAFLTQATGRVLRLHAVEFAAPAQARLEAYQTRFGIAPRFEAKHNRLEFDVAALAWPLLTHDAYLHAILERVAQTRRAAVVASPLDLARNEIAVSLLKGTTPTLDGVASACRLGPRALRARLADVPTTFRLLLDEVRRDLAREHLARGLSVTETAYLLGFSEPAALQHACKRWFQRSAGELRQPLGGR
jgi:AraC-like DNA-binding protein